MRSREHHQCLLNGVFLMFHPPELIENIFHYSTEHLNFHPPCPTTVLIIGNTLTIPLHNHYLVRESAELQCLTGVSNLRPTGRMQPRMPVNVAQQKIVNLLKTLPDFLCVWLRVAVCLMCGPRQLYFFQCGPETPKVGYPALQGDC